MNFAASLSPKKRKENQMTKRRQGKREVQKENRHWSAPEPEKPKPKKKPKKKAKKKAKKK